MLTGNGRAHHGEILREATRLTEAGKISVRLDPRRFTLAQVLDAYTAIKTGSADGKVVIDVQ
jgi:NADPH:quinone reductase-like Zn-dependent oxidoreductase